MSEAGRRRWEIAQSAEAQYWQTARCDDVELMRIVHEKAAAMRWALDVCPDLDSVDGVWLEIGIGPLGVGCIHLARSGDGRDLIGVDPLSPVELDAAALLRPVYGLLAACASDRYRQVTGQGEQIDLPDHAAGFVACYNVLDHCQDPAAVVGEAARLLAPGGHLLLGCDVYSFAGRAKYRLRALAARATGRKLDTIGDLAHPHQFVASDLEDLTRTTGLRIVATNRRPSELLKRVWSHSFRMLILARVG